MTQLRVGVGAVAVVVALAVGAVASGAPATAAGVRTQTGLGGFLVAANAAPFKVQLDDPGVPIPRPADAAIIEADPSYTEATINTGPVARATASSVWPGGLLGRGLPQLDSQLPDYPLKAEASYPGGEHAKAKSANGVGMEASAFGLDTVATASGSPNAVPGSLEIGAVASQSRTTVVDDVAIGSAVSKASDVTLLGLIHLGEVVSTVETRSDGRKGTSSGSTIVSGLTVMGQGFTVDDKGVHAGPQTVPLPGLPGQVTDPLKMLGVTIDPLIQKATTNGTGSSRIARGLRISIDTKLFRSTFDSIPGLSDTLAKTFGMAPAEVQGYLFYTLAASPKITFILGAAEASSAANLPLSIDFPPVAPLPPLPPDIDPGLPAIPGTPGSPFLAGTVGRPVLLPVANLPSLSEAGPTPAGLSFVPIAAPQKGAGSGGVPAALLLGALLVASIAGRFLAHFQAAALGGAVLGNGCRLGAPSNVPNLRGA